MCPERAQSTHLWGPRRTQRRFHKGRSAPHHRDAGEARFDTALCQLLTCEGVWRITLPFTTQVEQEEHGKKAGGALQRACAWQQRNYLHGCQGSHQDDRGNGAGHWKSIPAGICDSKDNCCCIISAQPQDGPANEQGAPANLQCFRVSLMLQAPA